MALPSNLQTLTTEQRNVLAACAEHPEVMWHIQSRAMPETMVQVDVMLSAGASPEWILARGDFNDLPVEIQTAFINALHWRQSELRLK